MCHVNLRKWEGCVACEGNRNWKGCVTCNGYEMGELCDMLSVGNRNVV